MSHFSTMEMTFVSADHLKKALADVSDEFGLHHIRENTPIAGYSGSTRADIAVATRNRGYDIGFSRENGIYTLVADWYGIKDMTSESLSARLAQQYAYHAVREKLEEKGFAVVEEEITGRKTIHMRVRRAV